MRKNYFYLLFYAAWFLKIDIRKMPKKKKSQPRVM